MSRSLRIVKEVKIEKKRRKREAFLCNNDEDCESQAESETGNDKSKKRKSSRPPPPTDPVERQLLFNSQKLHFCMYHCAFPAFNVTQWPLDNFEQLRDFPNCKLSVPRPVHIATNHCKLMDPCHQRTMDRSSYYKRLQNARTSFLTAQKNKRKLRTLDKEHIYPAALFDVVERLERHPDPFFHGSYDYYYTGGNLCVLPFSKPIVAHVDGDNLRNLTVSRLHAENGDKPTSLKHMTSHTFDPDSEIFEVQPLFNICEKRRNIFAVRQRNCITLRSLKKDGKHSKGLTQFQSKTTPFISFTQSRYEPNKMLVSSMKQHVRLYDLVTQTPTLNHLYGIKSHGRNISWNTVKSWQEHTYLYANEQELCVMDVRTKPAEWLKNACGLPSAEFYCDVISAVEASQFSYLAYIATNHKLHCLDIRYIGQHFEDLDNGAGAVCRWRHQMDYAPAFMQTFRNAGTEYIAMASALAGDIRICELTRQRNVKELKLAHQPKTSKHLYQSLTLPYQPPTLQEAYQGARLAGKCLRPDSDLANRISFCNTGLAFYNATGDRTFSEETVNAQLLISNSNGDVFAHSIEPRESQEHEKRIDRNSDEMMNNYDKQIRKITQASLNYTDIVDMKEMSKIFRCKALSDLKEDEDELIQTTEEKEAKETQKLIPKRRHLGRWQKSLSNLHSYKDALVTDLLAIWDIDYEEETDITLSHMGSKQLIKHDPESIVSSWLQSNEYEAPMTSIPAFNLNSSQKLNTSSSSAANIDETAVSRLNQSMHDVSTDAFEFLPQSTQIKEEFISSTQMDTSEMQINDSFNSTKPKPKFAKKKTKYVKGF